MASHTIRSSPFARRGAEHVRHSPDFLSRPAGYLRLPMLPTNYVCLQGAADSLFHLYSGAGFWLQILAGSENLFRDQMRVLHCQVSWKLPTARNALNHSAHPHRAFIFRLAYRTRSEASSRTNSRTPFCIVSHVHSVKSSFPGTIDQVSVQLTARLQTQPRAGGHTRRVSVPFKHFW